MLNMNTEKKENFLELSINYEIFHNDSEFL